MRLLYHAGADPSIKNNSGDTLLMVATKKQYYAVIDFLLEESINTIEELELAACSLIDASTSNKSINEAFELLKLALQRRELQHIPKICVQPMDIYDYLQECQTVDELDCIKDDRHRSFIETLLIRERVFLSRKDMTLMEPLKSYGDMLANRKEFDKCLKVWLFMSYRYQQMDMELRLHRFVWLFCKMLGAYQTISVECFLQVCQLVFDPSQTKTSDMAVNNALFLVIIATKVIIF